MSAGHFFLCIKTLNFVKMNRRIVIQLCFALLSAQFVFAQGRFEVVEDTTYVAVLPTAGDWVGHSRMYNLTNETIELGWIMHKLCVPPEWSVFVCDGNNCYGPMITECPDLNPNVIGPGVDTTLDVHVGDNGVNGLAHVTIDVFEIGDTANAVTAHYIYNGDCYVNATKNHQATRIRLYPNPVYDMLHIDASGAADHFGIYDLLGKQVVEHKLVPSANYDISHMQRGIYFVKFYRKDGSIIRSIKIQKN